MTSSVTQFEQPRYPKPYSGVTVTVGGLGAEEETVTLPCMWVHSAMHVMNTNATLDCLLYTIVINHFPLLFIDQCTTIQQGEMIGPVAHENTQE